MRGSVARYVWDLAGLDRSGWVVPLGAAGDERSPYAFDQLDAWVEGRLLPVAGRETSEYGTGRLSFSQAVVGPRACS